MNLWLIGMMGSGKSTIGPLVASDLGMEFIDTDDEIEARLGESIAEHWLANGEEAFRMLERSEVVRVSSTNAVISAGGGAPTSAANRATMMSTGRIIWLRAGVEALEERLAGSAARPALADRSIAEVVASREPIYARLADARFDTDTGTPADVAREIVAWWSG